MQLKLWPFCNFLAYFGQNFVAMATSLRPLQCLLWISRPRKPHVISNRILVISRRNALMCINSNFCPKIGCHGNALSPLRTGVSLAVTQPNLCRFEGSRQV